MSPAPCPRLFEVEAARDGRLTRAELAGFEQHARTCTACGREIASLAALADALRKSPREQGDELHVRRERTRLLASFDRNLLTPEKAFRGRWLVWSAPVLAVAVGLFFFLRARSSASEHASIAMVRAEGDAAWSRRVEAHVDEIRLDRGSLWIHVDHAIDREGRVVVLLPDGELEDTGTTFTVSAEDGHTTRVLVEEGSVVLRVRGASSVAIGKGETWVTAPAAPPADSASVRPSIHPPAPARSSVPSALAIAPSSHAIALAKTSSNDAPKDPSVDFRAAISALDRGDNAMAAAAFATFSAEHPRDPRAEDAAYLRVIALQRSGDDAAMKTAAKEYLLHYPAGLRRAEVQGL